MNYFYTNNMMNFGSSAWMQSYGPALVLLVVWTLFWKGLALWHAGKRGQPAWFVVLLLLNTAGILDIIYLFLILKLKSADLFKK